MVIFFDDDDFEPLGQGRDDVTPGSPADQDDSGADLDRIDSGDYLLEAGFAAEAHLGQLVDGDDDGDGNPWTPAGLEDRFYEDMREHLDGAPDPGTREALQGDLDRIWERTRPGIVGREHARRLRKRATVGEGMLARYRELAAANPALAPMVLREADDTLGRLRGLGTARDAIDERRRMFRTEVRDAVLNRASETDPRGALEAFKSGGYAELFDGDDEDGRKAWEGHLTQAAVTRDDDDAWERERGELENRQMKGLAAVMFRAEREQDSRSGDVSGAKITQAVKSGLIGREEGEQLRQAALARRAELKEEAGRYAEISDTIMRGKALPIRTREWIDPWYREVMKPALELMDPRAREVVDLDIIRRAGRVPEDRIREIRRGLNGDDPQAVIDSAGWIGRLRDEMPEMLPILKEWLPHGEYGRAVALADAIDAGYPAGKIIEELPRPVLTDKFWRRDPSEGDGIEPELLDSGGGGEAGGGAGGEAEGADGTEENEAVPAKSGDPDNGDQVAMGAVGAAKVLLKGTLKGGGKALEQARKRGREIRNLIRQQTRKPDQKGDLPKPNPVPAAEIVTTAKRLFDEINEERRAEGKKERSKISVTPEQFRSGASGEDAIEGLADAVFSDTLNLPKDRVVEIRLGRVSDQLAVRVEAETGIDLAGMDHAIDTQQLRHANTGHGPENENQADQEPLSPEVLSMYVQVVENSDRISKTRKKGGGNTIRFEKDVNGVIAVVEQVRRSANTFSFHGMWIKKKK